MKYLFISAHPDDLEFSCANLIRHLAQNGHDVKILCLTKGEFGIFQQDWIGPRLARIRESELLRAAKINAITPDKIFFGEFIDGFLKFTPESVTILIQWLNRFQPDIVFAPEALYAYYWQVDHIHCGRILHHIYFSCQDRLENPLTALYFYNTLRPNFLWPFNDPTLGKQSFLQHRSQLWFIKWIMLFYSLDKINLWRRRLGNWKYAERYRRIIINSHPASKTIPIFARGVLGLISHLPAFNPDSKRYMVEHKSTAFAKEVQQLCERFYPENA
ncbi:MAG: PIG-L deacetylase family protein [Promethearchaeota archaeon]